MCDKELPLLEEMETNQDIYLINFGAPAYKPIAL